MKTQNKGRRNTQTSSTDTLTDMLDKYFVYMNNRMIDASITMLELEVNNSIQLLNNKKCELIKSEISRGITERIRGISKIKNNRKVRGDLKKESEKYRRNTHLLVKG